MVRESVIQQLGLSLRDFSIVGLCLRDFSSVSLGELTKLRAYGFQFWFQRAEIVETLGYTPSYKKVWVGKQKSIERVFGNWEESYVALPKYLGALQKFIPETIVEWCVSRSTDVDEVEFRCVFWAFAPSIKEFHYCRPVISIDGTHLYGKYKGKMLIAMGVDGDNQILLLAFAIVENESYDTWDWFLSHVKNHVTISNCHGGILKVITEHGSPWLESCGFHRIESFSLSCQESESNSKVQLHHLNPHARHWLESHPLNRWALAHDGGRRYELLTTNLSKIFTNEQVANILSKHR
uniref:MULE transposase domain-containing protein n=1 Tax=Lactuca sativa TaxID=4236 RepID=A0A9R1V9Y6_LACSA|nr:hypothetical protein LSAT_V11C600304220 [Lactuca sativa]